MIHFQLFYHLVRRSQSTPKHYLFILGRLKNMYWALIPKRKWSRPTCTARLLYTSLQIWDQLGVTWQTKQRFFFAISGASNFKHFKQLFMTLSGLGSLTMWELPRWVSFFVSSLLWNYFSCFLQDFWSSRSFLAFKTFISPWSFYRPTFGFFQFLAVSTTDKPVNRSIHAYALT